MADRIGRADRRAEIAEELESLDQGLLNLLAVAQSPGVRELILAVLPPIRRLAAAAAGTGPDQVDDVELARRLEQLRTRLTAGHPSVAALSAAACHRLGRLAAVLADSPVALSVQ